MARGRALVGTSGWTYPHWRGVFYPEGLPARRRLAHLASRFPTVEVNGTFYSLTRPETCDRWRAEVPPSFIFAVKASRYITHMLRLEDFAAPLANFFASGILRFGAQLGPILWQLPPGLRFDRERARPFLRALPRDVRAAERLARRHDARLRGRAACTAPDGRGAKIRHALEVRDETWLADEALALLAAEGIALASADTAGRYPLSLARTTPDFAYARLHGSRVLYGSRYSDAELDAWAARIEAWRAGGADVYVYFDNDYKAYAPGDAERLLSRLTPDGAATRSARGRGRARAGRA
jgi:uncharacterized protein YecE (DUF72 family)